MVLSLSLSMLIAVISTASADEPAGTDVNEDTLIVDGLSLQIDPFSTEDSYTKTCYLVQDDILDDGTIMAHCSDIAPRYGYNLNMTMYINKVAPSIYSVEVEAYTGAAILLIKSFTAVLDYGNGDRIQGLGVNQPPFINGCSTVSKITYPNRVYNPGTYTLEITSFRLIVCEYINTDNTEEAGLWPLSEQLIVG